MKRSTTYPHQDLMAENKILATELPDKTQRKIKEFNASMNELVRESLDESIYYDVKDEVAIRKKKKKEQDDDQAAMEKLEKLKGTSTETAG